MAVVTMPARLRRHVSGEGLLGAAAAGAGWLSGRVLALLPSVPGFAGSVMVSFGAGEFAGHVFGHGLTPWVALTAGGMFALLLDRRL